VRIATVVFDYRDLTRYERLFLAWEASVRESNPDATIDVLRIPVPEITGEHKASFVSNTAKFQAWREYLDGVDEPVILMDCDMIVRRDLSDAFDGTFDIGLTKTGRDSPPYNGGVVFVAPTKEARDFIKLWDKVNTELYTDPQEHAKWWHWYKGMNQAALGKILESIDHGARIKNFPCREWNSCDYDWGRSNPDVVRVIHIKSGLRKVCLGETKKPNPAWQWEVEQFRLYAGIVSSFDTKPTSRDPKVLNPRTYMERVVSKKHLERSRLITRTSDKILVREYLKEKGLGQYIVPILAESGSPCSLPWGVLPRSFIIKMNNASGRNIFIEDKNRLAYVKVQKTVNKWLAAPYGQEKDEWAYKDIKPKSLIEPWLDITKVYRVDVTAGTAWMAQVYRVKRGGQVTDITTSFLPEWRPEPVRWNDRAVGFEERPACLDELVKISQTLGEEFSHVRVDWMEDADGKLWFSELTQYPLSGRGKITPYEYDLLMGDKWGELIPKEEEDV
jgi:hypothetical protein